MHSFEYLVRFVAEDASITYGSIPQAMATKDLVGTRVSTLSGNIDDGFAPTSQKKVVRKVCSHPRYLERMLIYIVHRFSVRCPQHPSFSALASITQNMPARLKYCNISSWQYLY